MTNSSATSLSIDLTTGAKLGPYTIIDLSKTSSMIYLIMMTIVVFIGILLYVLIIKYILKQPEPRRPVDWMLLCDQIIQATSYSFIAIMVLIMQWMNKSIKDIFGQDGCLILFIMTPIYMWERLVGGLGLSVFRYLFMEKPDIIQKHGVKKMIKYIWSFEALLMTLPLITASWNMIAERGIATATVCKGIPFELYKLEMNLKVSQDEETLVSSLMNNLWKSFTVARVSLVLVELVLNILLYHGFYKHTNKVKSILSSKHLTKRMKKSAISLEGHLMVFFINLFFDVIIAFSVVFNDMAGLEGFNVYNIGMIVTAVSNFGTLLASPELRREYFGDDDIFCPKRGRANNEEFIKLATEQTINSDKELEEVLDKMTFSLLQ